jgi:glycosyltransferase involved in cell wall biosynthesis
VSSNAYPLLQRKSQYQFMGGAEFQQVIIGRHLRENGYDVSYITKVFDGCRQNEIIDGITVFKAFADEDGWPFLRFFFTKIPRMWRALKAADAQVYYQRGAAAMTGIVSLFCRIHKKTFIFSAAHDTNFIPGGINVPYWRDKILYFWGLKHANHILVQSHQQKRLLLENFDLDSSVVYNVYPRRSLVGRGDFVLWVANIKPMKRPQLFLQIARLCPNIEFRMVGGIVKGHESLYETVKTEAEAIDNLVFLGFQPLRATEELFDRAALFINTSELEGFPNTFLQAWSRGIPTASFFDPDDIIRDNSLGAVLTDISDAAKVVRTLIGFPSDRRRQIQDYFNCTHLPERYFESLNIILESFSISKGEKSPRRISGQGFRGG